MKKVLGLAAVFVCLLCFVQAGFAAGRNGYYRFPAIHGDVVVFTSEGDLWTVDVKGGTARRLTSHFGMETYPAISPDCLTLAFSAQYEGPTEVYAMPLGRGQPVGRPPTRAIFRQDDQDLRHGPDREGTVPLHPGHGTSAGS